MPRNTPPPDAGRRRGSRAPRARCAQPTATRPQVRNAAEVAEHVYLAQRPPEAARPDGAVNSSLGGSRYLRRYRRLRFRIRRSAPPRTGLSTVLQRLHGHRLLAARRGTGRRRRRTPVARCEWCPAARQRPRLRRSASCSMTRRLHDDRSHSSTVSNHLRSRRYTRAAEAAVARVLSDVLPQQAPAARSSRAKRRDAARCFEMPEDAASSPRRCRARR